jgi:hypothetical protein
MHILENQLDSHRNPTRKRGIGCSLLTLVRPLIVLLVCIWPSGSFAQLFSNPIKTTQRAGNSASEYSAEALQKFFRAEALTMDIEITKTKKKLELREEPLLNWQNTERQLEQGSFFVWMDGTRPGVVASIFTYEYNGTVYRRHEVISMLPKELIAKLDGVTVWTPGPAIVDGKVMDKETEPAPTPAKRLTQMRNIARGLSGKLTLDSNGVTELRLMPQPLIRYQSDEDGIIDGALFSLAVGTDPEILFAVEARKKDGVNKWFVAPFRSHYGQLELSLAGETIWSTQPILDLMSTSFAQMPYAKEPFFVYHPPTGLPSPERLK